MALRPRTAVPNGLLPQEQSLPPASAHGQAPVQEGGRSDPAPCWNRGLCSPMPQAWRALLVERERQYASDLVRRSAHAPQPVRLQVPTEAVRQRRFAGLASRPGRRSEPRGHRLHASGCSWAPEHNAQPREKQPERRGCPSPFGSGLMPPAWAQTSPCGSDARRHGGSLPASRWVQSRSGQSMYSSFRSLLTRHPGQSLAPRHQFRSLKPGAGRTAGR